MNDRLSGTTKPVLWKPHTTENLPSIARAMTQAWSGATAVLAPSWRWN